MRALVTGATGFVGGLLARKLLGQGAEVRCLARDRSRAQELADAGAALHEGNVLDTGTLAGCGEGMDVAYYLVHGMGRGSDSSFVERERKAARNFARTMKDEGVDRVVYLGGLGEDPSSKHLKSRHETGQILAAEGPDLTYFRAAMVLGSGSESYKTLRYLVRLPVVIAPSWLNTPTQPIAGEDVISFLSQAPRIEESRGREIQIGGPDVVSYEDMLDLMAGALNRRPKPKLRVPALTPGFSARWIGLVSPVDAGVAAPLVEGLATKTVVTDPQGMTLFDVDPMGIDEALRRAIAAE
ncbi:MAG: NAD(P)H-binding protein [Actinomycetota bacterium]|nr:NAD(P)H-binding protein [Actinomycetota bacterium]